VIENLDQLFTDPTVAAAVAAAVAWAVAAGLRQYFTIPPAYIALAVALAIFTGAHILAPEDQTIVISILRAMFATLAAMGISLGVEKNAPGPGLAAACRPRPYWRDPWR
jgi:hypothetical protein